MVTATGIAPGSEMTAQMEQVEERNVSGVLHVAAIFGSHMVLQRNKPIAVFERIGCRVRRYGGCGGNTRLRRLP